MGIPGAFHSRTGHYCDANNVRPVRRQSLARGATLRFGRPEIGPVAPFYFTMSCSLMTDRLFTVIRSGASILTRPCGPSVNVCM